MASSGNKYGGTGTPTGAGALSAARAITQSAAGVPTHSAPKNALYRNETTGILYINTDGATTWVAVGSGASTPVIGQPGQDGRDGEDGEPGLPGRDGAAGPAGASVMGPPGFDGADAEDSGLWFPPSGITPVTRSFVIGGWFDPTNASTTVSKITLGPMPFAGMFVKATIKTNDGETNGATAQLVDIHKQLAADENTDTSTTVFTTQSNRPTITNANKAGSTTTFDVTTFAKGDYFRIFSDQLGTTLTSLLVGIEVLVT